MARTNLCPLDRWIEYDLLWPTWCLPSWNPVPTVGDGKEQTSCLETAVHIDSPSLTSLNVRACVQGELLD